MFQSLVLTNLGAKTLIDRHSFYRFTVINSQRKIKNVSDTNSMLFITIKALADVWSMFDKVEIKELVLFYDLSAKWIQISC